MTAEAESFFYISCLHEDGRRTYRCDNEIIPFKHFYYYLPRTFFKTYEDAHKVLRKIWQENEDSMAKHGRPGAEVELAACADSNNSSAKIRLEIVKLKALVLSSESFEVKKAL